MDNLPRPTPLQMRRGSIDLARRFDGEDQASLAEDEAAGRRCRPRVRTSRRGRPVEEPARSDRVEGRWHVLGDDAREQGVHWKEAAQRRHARNGEQAPTGAPSAAVALLVAHLGEPTEDAFKLFVDRPQRLGDHHGWSACWMLQSPSTSGRTVIRSVRNQFLWTSHGHDT